jgi:hypothetical protein
MFCITASATNAPKPVFIKPTCDSKISQIVLSSLRDEIRASPRYRLATNLADEGRMDLVLTLNISCSERDNVAAVAIVYGVAKCFADKNCHLSIDGTSIRAEVCEANAENDCGRRLFKTFDDYVDNASKPALKLY